MNPAAPGDYGRRELLDAARLLDADPGSAEAYRRFRETVESLRPRFTEDVAELADRQLAFGALAPMMRVVDAPVELQMDVLGVTVWPAVFELSPRPGETAAGYVERLCAGPVAVDCRYVVPEWRPLVLSEMAWDRFRDLAIATYAGCDICTRDPGFQEKLDAYARYCDMFYDRVADAGDAVELKSWPRAGARAAPWGDHLLMAMPGGTRLGQRALVGDWRRELAAARGRREVLGVYLDPQDRVRTLRDIAEDAAAAGFRELALQARDGEYPYQPMEYRFAIGAGTRRARRTVRVRNAETIQVLVQAADATVPEPGEPMRLP